MMLSKEHMLIQKQVLSKMQQLSTEQAEGFYAEHSERPFFKDLVAFMTSGPVSVQVLAGENAIVANRDLMGTQLRGRPTSVLRTSRRPALVWLGRWRVR